MTPRGVASLDPRGLIGRIYVGYRYTLLNNQYINCGFQGFREEDFLSFSHYKSMGANDGQGVTSLDTRGLTGRMWTPGDGWQDLCRRPLIIASYLIY